MLKLSDVHVSYGLVRALLGISLEVREGEVVTLLGSNGAGKTTAIRAAQGLIRLSRGDIRFQGKSILRLGPEEVVASGLCMVPEQRYLFPHMSVLENLELGAYTRHARNDRGMSLEWVYRLFPVLERRHRQKAHTLSGGEQQMVAIGRALMSKPKLLMLDEPSQGLAPLLVDEVFRTIAEIQGEGISILLVEQNAQHALELAKRAYVLETGRIVREGPGRELLRDEEIRKAYLGL
ncbi:MAG: ABC transporter ATP-binding protein [Desulfobacteraceae bacterium]